MKTLNLIQGSKEWHDHRAENYNASEAPAMMGKSKHMTRDQLIHQQVTGETKEIGDFLQKLFNKGHAAEAAIRPFVEKMVGEELYPVTGTDHIDGVPLSASFDGLTLMENIVFEHKLWNEKLAANMRDGIVELHYSYQIQQQLMISGAEKAIFVTSDGTPDNFECIWVYPDKEVFSSLISGWKHFGDDMAAYKPAIEVVKPEASAIMALPAINIEIKGEVALSNLPVYEKAVMAFIENINTDLQTDQDFADAEKTVKFCGDAEKKLELVKEQALEQTADISQLFRTINKLKEEMRAKRLNLDKSVKTQKEKIKNEIIMKAETEYSNHEKDLNISLGGVFISINPNIAFALKGKKTVSSLKSAANDQVAQMKIETSAIADNARINLDMISEEYKFLFNDIGQIIHKPNDDFKLLVDSRINEHKEKEQEKIDAAVEEAAEVKAETEEPAPSNTVAPQSSGIKDDVKPIPKEERDANTDLIEAEVTASLLDNGFGAQTAKKMTKLLITNSIKHVTINY